MHTGPEVNSKKIRPRVFFFNSRSPLTVLACNYSDRYIIATRKFVPRARGARLDGFIYYDKHVVVAELAQREVVAIIIIH